MDHLDRQNEETLSSFSLSATKDPSEQYTSVQRVLAEIVASVCDHGRVDGAHSGVAWRVASSPVSCMSERQTQRVCGGALGRGDSDRIQ